MHPEAWLMTLVCPWSSFKAASFPRAPESCVEEAYAENNAEYSWLITDADDGYEELELDPNDFDVVFAYPWPGEEYLVTSFVREICRRRGTVADI